MMRIEPDYCAIQGNDLMEFNIRIEPEETRTNLPGALAFNMLKKWLDKNGITYKILSLRDTR